MPQSFIVHSKLFALFVGTLTLFSSCREEITIQKDPGSLSAGDYKVTGTASYTIAGEVSSAPVSGTLTVYAADRPNSFYFLEKLTGFNQLGYQVSVIDSKFSVESVYDGTQHKSTWYYGKQNGGGTLSPNKVYLDRYANTNATSLTTPAGELIRYTIAIRKHISIVATK